MILFSLFKAGFRIGHSLVLNVGQSILPFQSMKTFTRAFKKRVRRLASFKIYAVGIHRDGIYPRKPHLAFSLEEGDSPRRGVDSRRLVIAAWCFELSSWKSSSPALLVGGTQGAWEKVSQCKYLPV